MTIQNSRGVNNARLRDAFDRPRSGFLGWPLRLFRGRQPSEASNQLWLGAAYPEPAVSALLLQQRNRQLLEVCR